MLTRNILGKPFVATCLAVLLTACSGTVNDSITLADGERHEGALATVNGSVELGEGAEVTGSVRTVNGGIRLGEQARAGRAETVNGSIRVSAGARFGGGATVNGAIELGDNAIADGDLATINGRITSQPGCRVSGDVATTNGTVRLYGTTVEGTVATTNGNLQILEASRVVGGLHLRPREASERTGELRVIIGADSIIEGPIRIDSPARLFVHDSATVGEVSGAEIERYAGDRPE
ncbi:MAG: hypothetical protein JJT93_05615 [Gammaproteobacteria bacterium]|nr:hypothetical protein [Gammaproteobacteria bacterium]TVQ43993.1 MAG: hypothetical protein EA371_14255 [Gammaproteobacteria bacterium]